ncbi:hypothetical protein SAMN05216315_1326 [Nitrosospira sp. Nsp18]|nr:hypothetical protein SAMN05216315_1326 [Nitrosospira sp. Nsp18]
MALAVFSNPLKPVTNDEDIYEQTSLYIPRLLQ